MGMDYRCMDSLIENLSESQSKLAHFLQQKESSLHSFELFSSLSEGAIVVDESCRIIWLSNDYKDLLGIPDSVDPRGQHIEEILPTSQISRVIKSGQPTFVDLMNIKGRWCVVTRMPIKDERSEILGAVGFIFYTDVQELEPLFDKFARLKRKLVEENLIRPSRYALEDIIGKSDSIQQLRRQAIRAAQLDTTLLLLGETGTGKELLAQGVHQASPRSSAPFVGINMGALPESLVEAELFGAAPGAYTGIEKGGRKGKIQLANGGTLFLDEIAEMPLTMQSKLLRVLQEREVEALGSNRLERVDVRVIAATSRDLKQLVDEGQFRADLYYRLNVLPVHLPPLRERKEDISLLCAHMLPIIQQQSGLPNLKLSQEALNWLVDYSWPGNVRELQNRLERGCVMAEGSKIEPADLGAFDDLPRLSSSSDTYGLTSSRKQAETHAIEQALVKTGGNKSKAAKLLGISRATLYEKLKYQNPRSV